MRNIHQPERYTARDCPPPFFLFEPEQVTAPILLMMPHSGRFYPPEFLAQTTLEPRALRLSEDCWVDDLLTPSAALGLPVLIASHARAYVDLNRRPDELDPTMYDGLPPGLPVAQSRRVSAGLGVIPKLVARGMTLYSGPLPADEINHRLDRVYHPYHGAVQTMIARLKDIFGYAVLIDGHSMPSAAMTGGLDDTQRAADIVLGDNWGRAADRRVPSALESLLIRQRLRVRRNVPYAGGFITEFYGRPNAHVHVVQLEICRSLYMHERSFAKHAGFARLQDQLHDMMLGFVEKLPRLGLGGANSAETIAAE